MDMTNIKLTSKTPSSPGWYICQKGGQSSWDNGLYLARISKENGILYCMMGNSRLTLKYLSASYVCRWSKQIRIDGE